MGTRSLTFVYTENNEPIVNMYRQFDGYPSGHGSELAEFLRPLTIVNGLSGDTSHVANGMGCLAAQMVEHFKDGAGGIYLYPVTSRDCWQDYEYHVYSDRVQVFRNRYQRPNDSIFNGTWEAFAEFCNEDE